MVLFFFFLFVKFLFADPTTCTDGGTQCDTHTGALLGDGWTCTLDSGNWQCRCKGEVGDEEIPENADRCATSGGFKCNTAAPCEEDSNVCSGTNCVCGTIEHGKCNGKNPKCHGDSTTADCACGTDSTPVICGTSSNVCLNPGLNGACVCGTSTIGICTGINPTCTGTGADSACKCGTSVCSEETAESCGLIGGTGSNVCKCGDVAACTIEGQKCVSHNCICIAEGFTENAGKCKCGTNIWTPQVDKCGAGNTLECSANTDKAPCTNGNSCENDGCKCLGNTLNAPCTEDKICQDHSCKTPAAPAAPALGFISNNGALFSLIILSLSLFFGIII